MVAWMNDCMDFVLGAGWEPDPTFEYFPSA